MADIPGAAPASHQRQLSSERRSPLDVSDICVNEPTPQQKHAAATAAAAAAAAATPRASGLLSPAACGSSPFGGGGGPGLGGGFQGARARSAPAGPSERLSDVGVIKSVDW